MPLDLLQVEEVVGDFGDFSLEGGLFRARHLCLQVNGMDSFSELKEGLVLNPT